MNDIVTKYIKAAIELQVKRIAESQGYKRTGGNLSKKSKAYQRTRPDGSLGTTMFTLFLNLNKNPEFKADDPSYLKKGEIFERRPSFMKSSRARRESDGRIQFRDWGFNGRKKIIGIPIKNAQQHTSIIFRLIQKPI